MIEQQGEGNPNIVLGILFLVLIAIILFAAINSLTTTETTQNINEEQNIQIVASSNAKSSNLQESNSQTELNKNNMSNIKTYDSAPKNTLVTGKNYKAVITTNKGVLTVNLFQDDVPNTVNNFVFLSKEGFYNNTKSHRILDGFMAQFGDPLTIDDSKAMMWGTGDPGYKFDDEEFNGEYKRGTLAMANSGPNTNGSQFFIMHKDYPLPANYVIFGELQGDDSFDVLDEIMKTPVTLSRSGEPSAPTEAIVIESIDIVEG